MKWIDCHDGKFDHISDSVEVPESPEIRAMVGGAGLLRFAHRLALAEVERETALRCGQKGKVESGRDGRTSLPCS